MKIEIRNILNVDIDDELLLQIVIEELTYDNPLFKEAEKSNRSTRGIKKVLKNFTYTNGSYQLPRGYLTRLLDIAKELNIPVEILDQRSVVPFDSTYNHTIKLREYQFPALQDLSKFTDGLLVAPAGSGKTIIGIGAIIMCGQKSLWITHTKQLLFQFVDRIQKFVDIPESDIGLIYNGKWVVDRPVTAALVQTLRTDDEKLNGISNNFGTVITDECLVAGTKITLLNGYEKNIEDIINGDVTLYGGVSHKFSRLTEKTITLRTGHGELEGTVTHMLPCISKDKEILGLENKFNPFHEDDIVFKPMVDINKNDYLLYLPSSPHVTKNSIGIQKARLLSLIACDGHITKNLKCLQIGIVKDKDWFLNEMTLNTKMFDDSDLRISNCKRGDLIIRDYSKKAVQFVNNYVPSGKKSNIIVVPDIIKEASLEEIREYLQVVFDTEGSVTNQISLTMSSAAFIKDVQFLLRKFNIMGRIVPIKKHKGYLRIAINGYDALIFYKRIGFSMQRKQDALANLLKHTLTFVRTVLFKGVVYRCVPVLEKTYNNTLKRVYDFTTKEHVFSANNVLSSNCHHQPSATFTEVITKLNPYYLFGLTATPTRRDGLESVLYQNLGPIRHTISRAAVAGGVLTPTILAKYVNTPGIPEEVSYQNLLKILTKSTLRNTLIVKDVVEQANLNNICIVVTERVEHAELLYNRIKKLWPKTGIMIGKNSDKLRADTLQALHNLDITVLVCTSHLLGEGFDYAPLNRLFIGLPFRNPTRCEQLVGRVQRTCEGKTDAIIFDYVDSHGLTQHQYKNFGDLGCRYNVYRKLGCIIT